MNVEASGTCFLCEGKAEQDEWRDVRRDVRDEVVRDKRCGAGPKRGGSYLPAGLRGAARRALLAPAEDNFRAGAREEKEDGEGSG